MNHSTLEARLYFFACTFMWCNLSLFHFLDEKVNADELISRFFLRWNSPFENLANWLGSARLFPLRSEKITGSEKELLFSTADEFGDQLVFRIGGALVTEATVMHRNHPLLNESVWLYCYYCRFLQHTLTDFERILHDLLSSTIFYEHYSEHADLFEDMAAAMDRERTIMDSTFTVDSTRNAVWVDINTFTQKLSAEWQHIVLSAAHHLSLPNFDEEAT
jgi:hypothetical protein